MRECGFSLICKKMIELVSEIGKIAPEHEPVIGYGHKEIKVIHC